jgi:hypothetical protein
MESQKKAAQNEVDRSPMAFITKGLMFRDDVRLFSKQGLVLMLFVLPYTVLWAPMAKAQEVHSPATVPTAGGPSQTESDAIPDSPLPSNSRPGTVPASLSAMSPEQKLWYATENAFGLPSLIFAAAGAGTNQAQKLYPEFHQGMEGYGRYYCHSYADQAVDSYIVSFVLADALHTDPRYLPLRSGGFWARTKHVGASLLLTHTDSGQLTFNTAQVLGSGVAASISSLYYPERDRTASLVTQRWASNLAGDGLMMLLREFAPELISSGRHVCSNISFGAMLCKDSKQADR